MHVLTCRFFHIKRWSVLGVFLYQYAVLSPAVLTRNVAGTARQGRLPCTLTFYPARNYSSSTSGRSTAGTRRRDHLSEDRSTIPTEKSYSS